MRLREAQTILKTNVPRLRTVTSAHPTPAQQAGHKIANVSGVRRAVLEISRVPGFEAETGALLENALLNVPDNTIVDMAASSNFDQTLSVLQTNAGRLLDILSRALPEQVPFTISIKLPDPHTLADLKQSVGRIHQVLDDCARRVVNDGVRFGNFDTGTSWIELICATELVFGFTAAIVHAAQEYRKHELETLKSEQTIKAMSTTGKLMDSLQQAIEEDLKLRREALAEAVRKKHDAPAETLAHIDRGIQNLATLFASGAEVHRALGAPPPEEEAAKTAVQDFPDHSKLLNSLSGPTRLLAAPSSDDAGGIDDVDP